MWSFRHFITREQNHENTVSAHLRDRINLVGNYDVHTWYNIWNVVITVIVIKGSQEEFQFRPDRVGHRSGSPVPSRKSDSGENKHKVSSIPENEELVELHEKKSFSFKNRKLSFGGLSIKVSKAHFLNFFGG